MALIDKLSAIGDAIREKTGNTELLTLDEMPLEIASIETGGGDIEVEPIVLTNSQSYGCAGAIASSYIEMFPNTISTKGLLNTDYMFYNSTLKKVPFELNYVNSSSYSLASMFRNSTIEELPKFNGINPTDISYFIASNEKIKEFKNPNWNWTRLHTYNYANASYIFQYCRGLRKISEDFLKELWGIQTSSYSAPGNYLFQYCISLDEIKNYGMSKSTATVTSNLFSNTFSQTNRLRSFTFSIQEDGTPYSVNWKGQTIDLSQYVGYTSFFANLTLYGFTLDNMASDDESYQRLKDTDDWFSEKIEYSRYNHDSAVETINSLPDTSAYLATAGGTNTIKFKGASGSLTDGGAINTLTEEEIAVATAKGWTVSFA